MFIYLLLLLDLSMHEIKMSNWAPWLGPYTRQSEMALNREYEKCKPQCMPGRPNIDFSAEFI